MALVRCRFDRILGVLSAVLVFVNDYGAAVEITKLDMPHVIENGTVDSISLECQYRCNSSERKLVVKWFFNDQSQPFYQWIAEVKQEPVIADNLKTSIQLESSHNTDSNCEQGKVYRMKVLRPTVEMSGTYRCDVTTLEDQDSAEADMVIYAPPKSFNFNVTKTTAERATLTCNAEGAYPQPELNLYRLPQGETEKIKVDDVKFNWHKNNGVYQAVLTKEILDSNLAQDEEAVYECNLAFKEVKFHRFKRVTYVPGSRPTSDLQGVTDSSSSISAVFILVLLSTASLLLS